MTLFTKISLLSYLIIAVVGVILILSFEIVNRETNEIFWGQLKVDPRATTPVYDWGANPQANKI